MIDLSKLAAQVSDPGSPTFEGQWHAIELQPDLAVPQRFVIGTALSRNGKLHTFRIAEEAPRLQCFYDKQFSIEVWRFMRAQLSQELTERIGSKTKGYLSSSPQVFLGEGHYVSGSTAVLALNRTFDRIVTVVRKDRKRRTTGTSQAELRLTVSRWLKRHMDTAYDKIVQPEDGLLIKEKDTVHLFDIGFDDATTASSVISGCNAGLEVSRLNVLTAWNDLTAYSKIRKRQQIGLAVLQPTQNNIPTETVRAWHAWWGDFTYKLRESSEVLLAEDTTAEGLALQISQWYT